jgi:hypothetical protein
MIKALSTTLLLLISTHILAQESALSQRSWVQLAAQTCMQQAPKNAAVQALSLNASQLRNNCQCVAKDMWATLPLTERQQLLYNMQNQQKLQQVGQRLMARADVKQIVLACSAAAWWE